MRFICTFFSKCSGKLLVDFKWRSIVFLKHSTVCCAVSALVEDKGEAGRSFRIHLEKFGEMRIATMLCGYILQNCWRVFGGR